MDDWKMRGKPALVILHMQHGIVGELSSLPGTAEYIRASGIIPRQQALLKAFRERKLPVIYVNALQISKEQNPAGTLPAYGRLFQRMETSHAKPRNLEVIPDVAPQPGEPVLINWLMGAFTNSGLQQVLKARGADTLVLAGYATHVVVYGAIVQAVNLWYSVILASDACTSPPAFIKAHEMILEYMAPNLALVTTTEDVMAHL